MPQMPVLLFCLFTFAVSCTCSANDFELRITLYELSIGDKKRVEISLVNHTPPGNIKEEDPVRSALKIEFKMSIELEGSNKVVYSGALSDEDIRTLNRDSQKSGITLFGGLMETNLRNSVWHVVFNDAMSKKEAASVAMNNDEYLSLIKAIKRLVVLRESFRENWEKLSSIFEKTRVLLEK